MFKRPYVKIKLISTTLIVLLHAIKIFANSSEIEAGIPDSEFKYYAHSQEMSNWCWAASIQMILAYNHVSKSQREIVFRTFGTNYKGELPNQGGLFEDISVNLNNWDVDRSGEKYQVKSNAFARAPSNDEIIEALKRKDPVYIGHDSGPNTGHAVIITSCRYSINNNNEKIIANITVRDPWPSQENISHEGVVNYDYASFKNKIYCFWVITVKLKGDVISKVDQIRTSTNSFIKTVAVVINDFDNDFTNLKGKKFGDTQHMYYSNIKFPNEKSNHLSIGDKRTYYVTFYRGDNIDSTDLIYETLKSNFQSIADIKDEDVFKYIPRNGDDSQGSETRSVNILLDADIIITLSWKYSPKIGKTKPYFVSMQIGTKQMAFNRYGH